MDDESKIEYKNNLDKFRLMIDSFEKTFDINSSLQFTLTDSVGTTYTCTIGYHDNNKSSKLLDIYEKLNDIESTIMNMPYRNITMKLICANTQGSKSISCTFKFINC
jgi:hypothetical protein